MDIGTDMGHEQNMDKRHLQFLNKGDGDTKNGIKPNKDNKENAYMHAYIELHTCHEFNVYKDYIRYNGYA